MIDKNLTHKISQDTARMLNDYYCAKIKRIGPKLGIPDAGIAAGFMYMAMLGGTVAVIASVIEAVAKNNPELAQALREDMASKISMAGKQ